MPSTTLACQLELIRRPSELDIWHVIGGMPVLISEIPVAIILPVQRIIFTRVAGAQLDNGNMTQLYTKNGRPLQRDGSRMFSGSGTYLGLIEGRYVFDTLGQYAGTIEGDRLVYRIIDSARIASSSIAAPRRRSPMMPKEAHTDRHASSIQAQDPCLGVDSARCERSSYRVLALDQLVR
jgi:hypothetical protein